MSKNPKATLVLASTSKFRQRILEQAGICFEAVAPRCDEKSITDLAPKHLAAARAKLKAQDVAQRTPPGTLVLGADQVLGLEGRAFDKAETAEEASERLREFSGKTHFLYSAMCLVQNSPDGQTLVIEETVVDIPMPMRHLTDQDIVAYIGLDEWQGSVGCYRIEAAGRSLFAEISGDETAIIGLPIEIVKAWLSQHRSF